MCSLWDLYFCVTIPEEVAQLAVGIFLEAISTQEQQTITELCMEVTASRTNLSQETYN